MAGVDVDAGRRTGWPRRLDLELALWRHGWAWPLALASALAAAAVFGVELHLRQTRIERLRAERAAPAPAVTKAAPAPVDGLWAVLSRPGDQAADLRRVLQIAQRSGIALSQGQYGAVVLLPGQVEQLEASYGFAAAYPQARVFVETLLREMPHLAVDRLSFERGAVPGARPQVQMRLTLWRWLGAADSWPGPPVVSRRALVPREQLIRPPPPAGRAVDLFADRAWQAVVPPSPAPVPAPAAAMPASVPVIVAAPPPPYGYLGKRRDEQGWQVFLGRGDSSVIVREGDRLDDGYAVESIRPPTLTLARAGGRVLISIGDGE